MHYVRDTNIPDETPPPAPTNLALDGTVLRWSAEADLESGISHFIIEKNGREIATVPEKTVSRFGRPIFQGLEYSDSPSAPLVRMRFEDPDRTASDVYQVRSVNTVNLVSE